MESAAGGLFVGGAHALLPPTIYPQSPTAARAQPYPYGALEPHIDEATMKVGAAGGRAGGSGRQRWRRGAQRSHLRCRDPCRPALPQVHHQGHHQAYTDKMNQTLEALKGQA